MNSRSRGQRAQAERLDTEAMGLALDGSCSATASASRSRRGGADFSAGVPLQADDLVDVSFDRETAGAGCRRSGSSDRASITSAAADSTVLKTNGEGA